MPLVSENTRTEIGISKVSQPLTWGRDSRLRWSGQRDRDARARGRVQRVV